MRQLRGLGVVARALGRAGGAMWAISIDPPEVIRAEMNAEKPVGWRYASATAEELEGIGLLHQARTRRLASPATILVGPDGRVAWAYYSATVGERAPAETILQLLGAWSSDAATGEVVDRAEDDERRVTLTAREVREFRRTERRYEQLLDSLEATIDARTSELQRTAAELSLALGEKETLLREIHHRVKNNLQVVTSLLSLSADQTSSDGARDVLADASNRVRAMGLIHQQLYGSVGLDRIDFGDYVVGLTESLRGAYAPKAKVVARTTALFMTIELAAPLGLIVNELLTNAFKYGVPGEPSGAERWDVLVELEEQGDGLLLRVSDRGPGFADLDATNPTSLGFRLVRSLAKQIRGTLSLAVADGATVELTVPFDSPAA